VTLVTYESCVKAMKIMAMKSRQTDQIINYVVDRFIELRTDQSLSHEKLAEMAGVHRSTISLIESKKRSPTLKNCIRIASALKANLSQILKEAETAHK